MRGERNMNGVLKVTRFQLRESRNPMLIFYATILVMVSLLAVLIWRDTGDNAQVSGLGPSTVVFLFILGLNGFASGFKFMQANSVSRKRFYVANIIALIAVAALMAAIDGTLTVVLKQMFPYEGMLEQIYRTAAFIPDFIWSFSLYAFAAFSGWMVTMVYYRCDKSQKILVSLSPAFLFIVLVYLIRINGAVGRAIINFLGVVLGLSGTPNPYVAALSFLVGTAGVAALSFLLIRRMPIKS